MSHMAKSRWWREAILVAAPFPAIALLLSPFLFIHRPAHATLALTVGRVGMRLGDLSPDRVRLFSPAAVGNKSRLSLHDVRSLRLAGFTGTLQLPPTAEIKGNGDCLVDLTGAELDVARPNPGDWVSVESDRDSHWVSVSVTSDRDRSQIKLKAHEFQINLVSGCETSGISLKGAQFSAETARWIYVDVGRSWSYAFPVEGDSGSLGDPAPLADQATCLKLLDRSGDSSILGESGTVTVKGIEDSIPLDSSLTLNARECSGVVLNSLSISRGIQLKLAGTFGGLSTIGPGRNDHDDLRPTIWSAGVANSNLLKYFQAVVVLGSGIVSVMTLIKLVGAPGERT